MPRAHGLCYYTEANTWKREAARIRINFKNRLFAAYAALITVVVLAVVVVLAFVIARTNRDQERYRQQEVIAGDLHTLSTVFDEMDMLASQVAANMELLNFFIPLAGDDNPGNAFSARLMDSIRAGSLLATVNSASSRALRISVFNDHGDYVSTGALYETPERIDQTLSDASFLASLRDAFADAPGRSVVLGPHADMWSDNANVRLFTLVRPLATSYSSKIYGYIAVQQNVETLLEAPLWRRDDGASYALYNARGESVFPQTENREDTTIFRADVASTGWALVRSLPTRLLDAPYRRVYTQLLLLGALLLAILLVAVYLMADRISRPLREFSKGIEGIHLGNLTQDAPLLTGPYSEELQALDRTFRAMLLKLNRSIGFEMKAYLAALQSQMNPHFLYNMLSAIIETADEDGSARTVGMCEKLSAMLRYMADYANDQAPLRDEIANMRDYLDLMKVRYEEHFAYEIEADEALLTLRIPRMSLQPLAENCFQHGFKTARPPWRVKVRVYGEGDGWRIEVTDNGGGVTAEQIAKIHGMIDAYMGDIATNYSQLRLGGMGLVNTVLRLRLSMKGETSFEIEQAPGGGTRVTIGGSL